MIPTRSIPGSTSTIRKSRLDGKPSLLPKRGPGSIDRLSTEARKPTTTGLRSSSAEPPRVTIVVSRPSRDASASKIPRSRASRSHQGDRYGQSSMTPLRSSQHLRPTATPRTPSEDRSNRNWQISLERALAFVTVKDQRPLSNAAWQRATLARVQTVLAERGVCAEAGGAALVRPLTIARFIEVVTSLLQHAVNKDIKLNNENYITKLPHLSKRLLYPGQVSKSWLRTVNTLHAFPHALALIAYLLDLVERIDTPVSDESLYEAKDKLSCLRKDYLRKCWMRFQQPGHQFVDLNEEYLHNFKALFGDVEEQLAELEEIIKKYELCLEDEMEAAVRADEARRSERRDALQSALRAQRSARRALHAEVDTATASCSDRTTELAAFNADIERFNTENRQLKEELEKQTMSVSERADLLDKVDYDTRVYDSKRSLAEQTAKRVTSKESEVALWQKNTLDSCGQYQERLIRFSSFIPELAALAIDEKELMDSTCAERVNAALAKLRIVVVGLVARRVNKERERAARVQRRKVKKQKNCVLIEQTKEMTKRAEQAMQAELAKEVAEQRAWAAVHKSIADQMEELKVKQEEYAKVEAEREFWEKQDAQWRTKFSELCDHVAFQKKEIPRVLAAARAKRVQLVVDTLKLWNDKLEP